MTRGKGFRGLVQGAYLQVSGWRLESWADACSVFSIQLEQEDARSTVEESLGLGSPVSRQPPTLFSDRLHRQVYLQQSTSGRDNLGVSSAALGLFSRGQSSSSPVDTLPPTSSTKSQSTLARRGFAAHAVALRSLPPSGPSFQDFMRSTLLPLESPSHGNQQSESCSIPYLSKEPKAVGGRVYFETYGCQMNVSDMETVLAIMAGAGYRERAKMAEEADVIFVMTCAIRENAERKVWQRLGYFKNLKRKWRYDLQSRPGVHAEQRPPKVAVLGCMAERLKTKLLEADKLVDVVCGPDAYRDLPRLLAHVDRGHTGVNVMLSLDETYADITPVRICENSISAYVSIMRGCDNMCSYCIVPFTRGRERSRPLASIVHEVGELWDQGVKEVTLLGQNVNSYRDIASPAPPSSQPKPTPDSPSPSHPPSSSSGLSSGRFSPSRFAHPELSPGFKTIYKPRTGGLTFAHLLDTLSAAFSEMRFRFTSPHPKDFPDDLIALLRDRPNVCRAIHLPAQSGSSSVLERMRRGYTREAYLDLVERIRQEVPDISISSDFISGFCGETEADHRDTLSLLEAVGYDMAYMFAYSVREKTHAHRRLEDDVPEDVKKRRLAEVIDAFRWHATERRREQVGTCQLVLVEGPNKRNPETELVGTTDGNYKVVFPSQPVMDEAGGLSSGSASIQPKPGDYVAMLITDAQTATLAGRPLRRTSIQQWSEIQKTGVRDRELRIEACA